MPDTTTRIQIPAGHGRPGVHVYLADQTLPDGTPWECDPRTFAKNALDDLLAQHGLDVTASFEHEFMIDGLAPTAPFSFQRFREIEPFGSELVELLNRVGPVKLNWPLSGGLIGPQLGRLLDVFGLALHPIPRRGVAAGEAVGLPSP
jgi:glutamine synthetase